MSEKIPAAWTNRLRRRWQGAGRSDSPVDDLDRSVFLTLWLRLRGLLSLLREIISH
ncbi:hypothetical protein [Bosea sp. BK604]|uniref:hypothetical protein n=1 Tax=Bosea sp. BK604 TaxID=2512180 RepID=UPI001404A035|nr:hypothetical protein [Bosea sp. BK604]